MSTGGESATNSFTNGLQTYRMDLAYVGTRYEGFQSQLNHNTVQDKIEKALRVFFGRLDRVPIVGASRTDSGVHAEQQIIRFQSKERFDRNKWEYSLNCLLPKDITVCSIEPVHSDFCPIREAKRKVYRYSLWLGGNVNPFLVDYVWRVPKSIDLDQFALNAAMFVGKHDFSSFCSSDSSAKTREREIFDIRVVAQGPLIQVWIMGGGFLKQMVRIMIGTLVDISLSRLEGFTIQDIISKRNRSCAGQTASSSGLTLARILYNDKEALDSIIEAVGHGYCFQVR